MTAAVPSGVPALRLERLLDFATDVLLATNAVLAFGYDCPSDGGASPTAKECLEKAVGDFQAHVVFMEAEGDFYARRLFDDRRPMERVKRLALRLPEDPPPPSRAGQDDASGTPEEERRT